MPNSCLHNVYLKSLVTFLLKGNIEEMLYYVISRYECNKLLFIDILDSLMTHHSRQIVNLKCFILVTV